MVFAEKLARTSKSNLALIVECYFQYKMQKKTLSFRFEKCDTFLLFFVDDGDTSIRGGVFFNSNDLLLHLERRISKEYEYDFYVFANFPPNIFCPIDTFFNINTLKIPTIDWDLFDPKQEYRPNTLPRVGNSNIEILTKTREHFASKNTGGLNLFSALNTNNIVSLLCEEVFSNKTVVIVTPTVFHLNQYVEVFSNTKIPCGCVVNAKELTNKSFPILKTRPQIQDFINSRNGCVVLATPAVLSRFTEKQDKDGGIKKDAVEFDLAIYDRCDYFFSHKVFRPKVSQLQGTRPIKSKKNIYLYSNFLPDRNAIGFFDEYFSYSYQDAIKNGILQKFDIFIRIVPKRDQTSNQENAEIERIDNNTADLYDTVRLLRNKKSETHFIEVKTLDKKQYTNKASKIVAFLKPTRNKNAFRTTLQDQQDGTTRNYVLGVSSKRDPQLIDEFNQGEARSFLFSDKIEFIQSSQVNADVFYFSEEIINLKRNIEYFFRQICRKSENPKCCIFTLPIYIKEGQRILITKKIQNYINEIFSLISYLVEVSGEPALLDNIAFIQAQEELKDPNVIKTIKKIRNTFFNLPDKDIELDKEYESKKEIPFYPIYKRSFRASDNSIFKYSSFGVLSHRDSWVWADSKEELEEKINKSVTFCNEYLEKGSTPASANINGKLLSFRLSVPQRRALRNGMQISDFDPNKVRIGYHRPFIKKYFYFDNFWIDQFGITPKVFPTKETQNLTLVLDPAGHRVCVVDTIVNIHFFRTSKIFPLYVFTADGKRLDGISKGAVDFFKENYPDTEITCEKIFYYVFAVLQNEECFYNHRYSIPLLDEFDQYVYYGQKLADLYLEKTDIALDADIEIQIAPDPNYEIGELEINPINRTIIFNETITISNVPEYFFADSRRARSLAFLFYRHYRNTQGKQGFSNGKYVYEHLIKVINYSVHIEKCIKNIRNLSKKVAPALFS